MNEGQSFIWAMLLWLCIGLAGCGLLVALDAAPYWAKWLFGGGLVCAVLLIMLGNSWRPRNIVSRETQPDGPDYG